VRGTVKFKPKRGHGKKLTRTVTLHPVG
jgi:hypothetical protein